MIVLCLKFLIVAIPLINHLVDAVITSHAIRLYVCQHRFDPILLTSNSNLNGRGRVLTLNGASLILIRNRCTIRLVYMR